jgi:hypothetical protein
MNSKLVQPKAGRWVYQLEYANSLIDPQEVRNLTSYGAFVELEEQRGGHRRGSQFPWRLGFTTHSGTIWDESMMKGLTKPSG